MSTPSAPDLYQLHICDRRIGELIVAGRAADALAHATAQPHVPLAAKRLSDLACLHYMNNDLSSAIGTLQQALAVDPGSQPAFHNLASILLQSRQLHGNNLDAIRRLLLQRATHDAWAAQYRHLLYQPTFLNIEFVQGKCNLKCRMCIGTNAATHPNKLMYIEPEEFEAMLAVAPTITGITLSSGDSDPFLHPRFAEIIDIAKRRNIMLNIYTNGHPLSEKMAQHIVASGIVTAINFSIDAATQETYQRIRGSDLARVHQRIVMLQQMKRERGTRRPEVSMSFVAMRDNIEELPLFVQQAIEFGAGRVFVEDLIGWLTESNGNYPATDHPRCAAIVAEAKSLAAAHNMSIIIPDRLERAERSHQKADSVGDMTLPFDDAQLSSESEPLPHCGWMSGVWIDRDGDYQPCCMVAGAADMGSVADGPLVNNRKYARVKDLLFTGKVFTQCAGKSMCEYVQQQEASGKPLQFISDADLGDLAPQLAAEERRGAASYLASLTIEGNAVA